jgi:hypothetical protein
MKMLLPMLLMPVLFASCAGSVEQIVENNRQHRIEAAYAGHPLGYGAGDGLGFYSAATATQSEQTRLTLSDRPLAPITNP